jgi:hypothetical protein
MLMMWHDKQHYRLNQLPHAEPEIQALTDENTTERTYAKRMNQPAAKPESQRQPHQNKPKVKPKLQNTSNTDQPLKTVTNPNSHESVKKGVERNEWNNIKRRNGRRKEKKRDAGQSGKNVMKDNTCHSRARRAPKDHHRGLVFTGRTCTCPESSYMNQVGLPTMDSASSQ